MMKITRFAQSCLLIETKGKRILIDPGNIFFEESLLTDYWKDINILLVTHKHSDHCYLQAIMTIITTPRIRFYAPLSVAQAYKELHPDIVSV
ncbi:MAG: MBL fold metallo-hydrolase [bacterium]